MSAPHTTDHAGLHVSMIRKYETGTGQPNLDALRRLAVALSVPADALVFDKDERGPDEELRLQFEAASRLSPDEKHIIKVLIEGVLLQHEADARSHRLAAAG
jgi:transcriptional regulator with XRE-family HTH domain